MITLPIADEFLLRPDMTFLNHGSFGACPRAVFEVFRRWQRELEAQPVEFLGRRINGLLAEARPARGLCGRPARQPRVCAQRHLRHQHHCALA